MSGIEGNKQYRNSVFCSYFNEPTRLLSLCNAILNTNYQDAGKLIINTLDGMFFDDQKNDISCTIENHFLVLIEHQTSVNENMPFRELFNKLVEDKNKLYRKSLISFPAPRFIVLYDGDETEQLERKMKLSDAFGGDSSSLELIVTAYNINFGLKQKLLKKCGYLNDYSTLVGKVKEGIKAGFTRRDSISNAVKFCIDNGIMKGFLEFHSEEVFNMLNLQWDKDTALQARFDDGYDDGFAAGFDDGMHTGFEQGENRLAKLVALLLQNGKTDEVQIALNNSNKRNELYKLYQIV